RRLGDAQLVAAVRGREHAGAVLADMTLGVPNVDATKQFYREFGLTENGSGMFASADGGDQLRITESPFRRLIEFTLAADDADDLARIRAAASATDIDVRDHDDG